MSETLVKKHYALPIDPGAVRSDWLAKGYSFHQFVDPPGQEWKGFVHATNEYLTVAEGRLEVDIGSETVIATPGDLLFVPSGVTHSIKNIHSTETRWFFGYD